MEKLWMEEIVEALSKAFPEARIGTERVRQGFKAPCFLLRTEKASVLKELGNRYRGEATFSLRYFPEAEDAFSGAAVGEKAREALEGCVGFRELSVKAETDGTLSMTAAFSAVGFRVEKPAAKEKMDLQLAFRAAAGKAGE